MDLNYILQQFKTEKEIEPYGNGHINDTYVVNPARFIIQRINTNIFKNPYELMENIENVTAHLREKIIKEGGDPDRETLTVVKTDNGENFLKT